MIGPIVAIIVIVILVAVLVVVYVRRGRAIKLKSNGTSGSHIVNNEQEIVPDGMKVLKHVQYTAKPLENCETLIIVKLNLRTGLVTYHFFSPVMNVKQICPAKNYLTCFNI